MVLTFIALLPFLTTSTIASTCNADNCLCAFNANTYFATDFYRTYTSATPQPTPAPTTSSLFASPCASSAQRASSACSCVVPKQTGCVPTVKQGGQLLQNTGFDLNSQYWSLDVSKARNQPAAPGAHYAYYPEGGEKDAFLNITFPATGISPDSSIVTLTQEFKTLCSGPYRIYLSSLFYSSDSNSNCTVTTGIEGYPASFFTYNYGSRPLVVWGKLDHWNDFVLDGVPAGGGGAGGVFFEGELSDWGCEYFGGD